MWEVINFCILLLLLIIILGVLILCIFYYYKIKTYVDEAISHIGSLIPTFDPYEFTNIDYSNIGDLTAEDFSDVHFNTKIALFLCNINMTSYNIFGNFSSRLPENITLEETIGNNCYIYKYQNILIISYRGTKTGDDVITDLDSAQTEMSGYPRDVLVHRGFYRLWVPFKDEIKSYIKKHTTEDTKILITGH